MKKTVFLATATILGGLMAASAVSAATYPTAFTANTTGDVSFKAPDPNNTPDKPVTPGTDPDNPDHPDQPGNGGNENKGNLVLKWVSDFHFGDDHTISPKTEVYSAAQTKTQKGNYTPNYVEVYDQRGVNSGWDLTVTQNDDFKGDKTKAVLAGAQMSLVAPTLSEFHNGATSTIDTSAIKSDGTLNKGKTIDVMNAKQGTMPGTYFGLFHGQATTDATPLDDGVTLTVPGNAALMDKYSTTMTWTLTAAPDGSQTPATPTTPAAK